MAYLFNRLNEMIDGQQAPRASDVLGQQQAGGMKPAQVDRETPGAQGIASQPSAIIGGAGAPKPAAAGEDPTAVSSESRAKVFAKNQGAELQASAGTGIGKIGNSIANTQAKAQEEANKYVQGVQYAQVADETVDKAVRAGDEKATGAVRDLLYGAAPDPGKFAFDDSSLSGTRDQVKSLATTGGRQALLMGEGNRTAGEARLDASLLGRSKVFGEQRGQIINQFADLKGSVDAETKRTQDAATQAVQNREADKGRVRGTIGGIASRILGEVDERVGSRNSEISREREVARTREADAVRGDAQKALDRILATERELAKAGPYANWNPNYDRAKVAAQRKALEDIIKNPGKYLTQSSDQYGRSDVLTPEQRDAYNRAMELTGQGERLAMTPRDLAIAASRSGSVGAQLVTTDGLLGELAKVVEKKNQSDSVAPNAPDESRGGNILGIPTRDTPVPEIANPYKRDSLEGQFVDKLNSPTRFINDRITDPFTKAGPVSSSGATGVGSPFGPAGNGRAGYVEESRNRKPTGPASDAIAGSGRNDAAYSGPVNAVAPKFSMTASSWAEAGLPVANIAKLLGISEAEAKKRIKAGK